MAHTQCRCVCVQIKFKSFKLGHFGNYVNNLPSAWVSIDISLA